MRSLLVSVLAVVLLAISGAEACACAEGTPQGQYCGYCWQVTSGWVLNHVYECNPQGGCYDYGVRTSCNNEDLDQCPV